MAPGHAIAPRMRGGVAVRIGVLVVGLATCSTGIVSIYDSRLGLAPWDVLNQGVAEHTPLSFGTANIAIALAILLCARRLDVRVRVGTVSNAILLGSFVDVFLRIGWVERLQHEGLPLRIALLAAGILAIGLGTAIYLGAGMGAGPRDSLMLGITRRVRSRVGVVRTWLEVSATAAGLRARRHDRHRHARLRARDRPGGRDQLLAAAHSPLAVREIYAGPLTPAFDPAERTARPTPVTSPGRGRLSLERRLVGEVVPVVQEDLSKYAAAGVVLEDHAGVAVARVPADDQFWLETSTPRRRRRCPCCARCSGSCTLVATSRPAACSFRGTRRVSNWLMMIFTSTPAFWRATTAATRSAKGGVGRASGLRQLDVLELHVQAVVAPRDEGRDGVDVDAGIGRQQRADPHRCRVIGARREELRERRRLARRRAERRRRPSADSSAGAAPARSVRRRDREVVQQVGLEVAASRWVAR